MAPVARQCITQSVQANRWYQSAVVARVASGRRTQTARSKGLGMRAIRGSSSRKNTKAKSPAAAMFPVTAAAIVPMRTIRRARSARRPAILRGMLEFVFTGFVYPQSAGRNRIRDRSGVSEGVDKGHCARRRALVMRRTRRRGGL
jgi:hypothetical protein